jgi:hypothetical protein
MLCLLVLAIPYYHADHYAYEMSNEMTKHPTTNDDMSLVDTDIVDDGSAGQPHKTMTITIKTPHKDSQAGDWCVSGYNIESCDPASSLRVEGDHVILVFSGLPLDDGHLMISALFYKNTTQTAIVLNKDWPAGYNR